MSPLNNYDGIRICFIRLCHSALLTVRLQTSHLPSQFIQNSFWAGIT